MKHSTTNEHKRRAKQVQEEQNKRDKQAREEKRQKDKKLADQLNFLDEDEEIFDAANMSQEKFNRIDMKRR